MTRARVTQGRLDPVSLVVTVTPSEVVPDLSLVTEAVILSIASGTESEWSVDITAQSATELTLTHRFEEGDLESIGVLRQCVRLTISGAANPVDTKAWDLVVESR